MTAVVHVAGAGWDGVPGTDRRLAEALAHHADVVWVDPPVPAWRRSTRTVGRADRAGRAGAVRLVRTPGLPGLTRPVVRDLTRRQVSAVTGRWVRATSAGAVVLANPLLGFPRSGGDDPTRVFYVTDDWVAGAALMGLSAGAVARQERTNAAAADVVLAVSPWLAHEVAVRTGAEVGVLPNGCVVPPAPVTPTWHPADRPVVALVGQLNERLDLDVLDAVAGRDLDLLVVGPRRERDPEVARRLDDLLARPSVRWVGEQPADAVPAYLAGARVGLTPYAASGFNRASFPLKTLDYLAAGLPCVATPSSATDWLATPLVVTATDPEAFADAVEAQARRADDEGARRARHAYASRHSWDARARALLDQVDQTQTQTHQNRQSHQNHEKHDDHRAESAATGAGPIPGGPR